MKYVMFKATDRDDNVRFMPIIFPEELIHKDVADRIRRAFEVRETGQTAEPVSAGFCYIGGNVTDEKSESLGLGPHPDDEDIIKTYQYQKGIGWDERA